MFLVQMYPACSCCEGVAQIGRIPPITKCPRCGEMCAYPDCHKHPGGGKRERKRLFRPSRRRHYVACPLAT